MALNTRQCGKCGSEVVIPGVHVRDRDRSTLDNSLVAIIDAHPEAMFFRGTQESRLVANICGQCGFAELYAEEPAELVAAYQKQIASRS